MLLAPGVRVPRVTMNQPVLESHFTVLLDQRGESPAERLVLDGGNNNDVATNINQSTFGRITAQANSPRDVQLALKLLF